MRLDDKLLTEQNTTRETIIRNLALWIDGKLPSWWNSWEADNYQAAAIDILDEKLALQAELTNCTNVAKHNLAMCNDAQSKYQGEFMINADLQTSLAILQDALKAERIKALEQLADKVCTFQTRQGKLYITPREIRTMANELKEQ